MAAHSDQRGSDLSLPFGVARRERAFEVDQPGIAMGRRELLLILLAQIPPTPAEEKFMSQGFKCSLGAVGGSRQTPAIGLLFWIDGSERRHAASSSRY